MQLIGQIKIKQWLNKLTLENCPHYIVLQGQSGCGKSLVTDLIKKKLNCTLIDFNTPAEEVRNMINLAYKIKEPTIYCCENFDKMSMTAKSSLLKVTEDTPSSAYIICHSTNNTLGTLVSRAFTLQFEPYKIEELDEFCNVKGLFDDEMSKEDKLILYRTCETPGELEYQIKSEQFKATKKLAEDVIDYIAEVNKANAFRIIDRLSTKKDSEGLDCSFFLKVLVNCYIARNTSVDFAEIIIRNTLKALKLLENNSISKEGIMTKWLLNIIREIDYADFNT